ncbi:MAG: UDP-N-acetylmuramate dehydrogenase [Clostridia bacterium]|nr:UDP-N-acetylmuramate dehydrogenase [Clostridia bacterium]
MKYKALIEYAKEREVKYIRDFSTAQLSSFELGGRARVALFPSTIKSFCEILSYMTDNEVKFFVAGNCTNSFFLDEEYDGVIISTRKLNKIEIVDSKLIAMCGALITDCSIEAMKFGFSGMEFLCGIPGSVGGSIFMNSSAYEKSISEILITSTVYNIKTKEVIALNFSEHHFDKKQSVFSKNKNLILLSATFGLVEKKISEIREEMIEISAKRINSQPLNFGSCGSVFKRPKNSYASKLIDELGLKGFKIGGAEISKKHAGFIINSDNAKSSDVLNLIEEIKTRVLIKFGIPLEQEIIFLK